MANNKVTVGVDFSIDYLKSLYQEEKGLNYTKKQTDLFHKTFGHPVADKPTELTKEQVRTRVNFIAEELVELLAAVSETNVGFYGSITSLVSAITEAELKSIRNGDINAENKLVAVADGLTDINYFVSGTFSMMGVEPQPLFDIVQEANMSKLGPDGKPIYRKEDGKIMKPEGWEPPEPKLALEIEKQIKNAEGK